MNSVIGYLASLLAGSVLIVNGVAVDSGKLINDAKETVNHANMHQIATVLELYYLEHGTYPDVVDGEALFETFKKEGLVRNEPLDPNIFTYYIQNNGETYYLALD